MRNSKLLGRWGEQKAVEFLRKNKYSIVGIGYRTRFGEIDIIAENRKYIVFAEVKLRKNSDFAEAKEFVDFKKQEKLRMSAQLWLAENEINKQSRFDVIEIYAPDGEKTAKPIINQIINAF